MYHPSRHAAPHVTAIETQRELRVVFRLLVAVLLLAALVLSTRAGAEQVPMGIAATEAAAELVAKVANGAGFVDGWQRARLGGPAVVYDPNGDALFYEFPVVLDDRVQGRIKVAADTLLGASVVTMERGGRELTAEELVPFAVAAVQERHSELEVVDAWPVIVRDLQLGVAVACRDLNTDRELVITVDADTLVDIPAEDIRSTLEAAAADEPEERMARWEADDRFAIDLGASLARRGIELAQLFESPLDEAQWQAAGSAVARLNTATWQTVDLSRAKLYTQIAKDGCARAVLQMFNHFHLGGPKHSQAQIATILGAWGWGSSTVSWETPFLQYLDQHTGLPGSYYITINPKAGPGFSWTEMTLQVDANRPFAAYQVFTSWDTAHIMFAVGYLEEQKEVFGGYVFEEKWLGLYDPAGGVTSVKLWNDSLMSYQLEGYVVAEK